MTTFKSIVAIPGVVYLIPAEGHEVVTLTGNNLVTDEELVNLLANISKDGYTTLETASGKLEYAYYEYLQNLQAKVSIDLSKLEDHIKHSFANNADNMELFIDKMEQLSNHPELNSDIIKFVASSDMPITATGNILGFRRVVAKEDGTLVDGYTRKIPQQVGTIIRMHRSNVDNNRNKGCSFGLHVGTREYVRHYTGSVLQLVLVNPADIISVPYADYSKMRVCEYTIVHQFTQEELQDFLHNKYPKQVLSKITDYVNGYVPAVTSVVNVEDTITVLDASYEEIKATGNIQGTVEKTDDKSKSNLDIRKVMAVNDVHRLFNTILRSCDDDEIEEAVSDVEYLAKKYNLSLAKILDHFSDEEIDCLSNCFGW